MILQDGLVGLPPIWSCVGPGLLDKPTGAFLRPKRRLNPESLSQPWLNRDIEATSDTNACR